MNLKSTIKFVVNKKTNLLLLLSILFISEVIAQTPTHNKIPVQSTNTNGNSFPFGTTTILTTNGIKWQTIYPFTYLNNPVNFGEVINKIYIRSLNTPTSISPITAGSPTTITNLTIKLGLINDTSFTNTTFLNGLTQCAQYASITLAPPTIAGGWIEIPLQNPYLLTSTSGSIVVEISMSTKTSSNGFGVSFTIANSTRRLTSTVAGASNALTGTASTVWTDMGFEIINNTPCSTPSDQPTTLILNAIPATQINGSFTQATSYPSNYLVVRYPTGATPTSPIDGTSYSVGSSIGLGTVISNSLTTSFTDNGLPAMITYDYYVYSFNNLGCFGGPLYQTSNPLMNTICSSSPSITSAYGSVSTLCNGDTTILKAFGPFAFVSTFAGNGIQAFANGSASTASFSHPTGLTSDANGNIYVADRENHRIRKISPTGNVSTLAGNGNGGVTNGIGSLATFTFPSGVECDAAGNVYVADQGNYIIRKITPAGNVTTFAGDGTYGSTDGPLASASFGQLSDLAFDVNGNLFVADQSNHTIRKITPAGIVSTFAGNGSAGYADGVGTLASFNYPASVACDANGNVIVADAENHAIRKITPSGLVTTLAIAGPLTEDGTGISSTIYRPYGVICDASGNVYFTSSDHKIRKISSTGYVSTMAGYGFPNAQYADGYGNLATFSTPFGITLDVSNNLYVSDYDNHTIRKLLIPLPQTFSWMPSSSVTNPSNPSTKAFPTSSTTYTVTASTGTGCMTSSTVTITVEPTNSITATAGLNGTINPPGISNYCTGLYQTYTITPDAGFQIADVLVDGVSVGSVNSYTFNYINASHTINASFSVIPPCVTPLDQATGIQLTSVSNSQINVSYTAASSNPSNYLVVRYLQGAVETVPSNGTNYTLGSSLGAGIVVHNAGATSFNDAGLPVGTSYTYYIYSFNHNGCIGGPLYLTSNPLVGTKCSTSPIITSVSTSLDSICIGDSAVLSLLAPAPGLEVSTFVGQYYGYANGIGTQALFAYPTGLATDATGNIYVADRGNYRIRKITPTGLTTTFAGNGSPADVDGLGIAASFQASGIAIDVNGNIIIADWGNQKIKKITPAGMVTTIAGTGSQGFQNGAGNVAKFYFPQAVASDANGNIYVADGNNMIRKITPAGIVSTLAGNGAAYYADGPGVNASFFKPTGIAIDVNGDLFIADSYNNRIRKVTQAGMVSTFAGSGVQGSLDGMGTSATFNKPFGVCFDANGNLYVTDKDNEKIRKITPAGQVTTIAGNGSIGSIDSTGIESSFNQPYCITADANNNLYVSDYNNHRIRKLSSFQQTYTWSPANLLSNASSNTTNAFPTATTIYTVTASNGTGCTINSTVIVTVKPNYAITASAGTNGTISPIGSSILCEGDTMSYSITPNPPYQIEDVLVDGTSVGAVSNYTFSNVTAAHVISASFVCPASYSSINESICQGSSYTFNGIAQTLAGTYYDTLINAIGCDSIITLNLTITPSTSNTTTASACDTYTWSINNQIYTSSTYDSVVTGCHTEYLNLTITPSTSNTTTASACDTYTWLVNNQTYTSSTYDSVVTGCHTEYLNLTITPSSTNMTTVSSYVNYTWSVNNTLYTNSGTYSTVVGCVTHLLNLTITVASTISPIICPNSSVTLIGTPPGGTFNIPNPYSGPATSFTYTYTDVGGNSSTANGNVIISSVSPANIILPITKTATTAIITWNAIPGSSIYYVWYKPSTSSTWLTPTTTGTTLTLTGLIPNTQYDVKIRNNNLACSQFGVFGTPVQFTTLSNPCGIATTLNPVVLVPTNKAKISWQLVAGATQYSIWYKKTTSSSWSTFLASSTTSSFTTAALATGFYEVKIRNKCATGNFSSFGAVTTFTIGNPLKPIGSSTIDEHKSYTIFPNPTSSEINIEFEADEANDMYIKVFDMTGRIIKQIQTKSLEGLNNIIINLNDVASGIYTIQIFENNQAVYKTRVNKQD